MAYSFREDQIVGRKNNSHWKQYNENIIEQHLKISGKNI